MTPDTILWKSGNVKRWHCNLERALRESGDTTASHQWRCAMLLMMLHPLPSAHLLGCVLTHDVPEIFMGDVPAPMKSGHLKEIMERYEARIAEKFEMPVPSDKDARWVKLCDKLDAVLWVREHAAHMLATSDWIQQWEDIIKMSKALGCYEKVEELVQL